MTKIINLFGGPCSGKTTTAAFLFAKMKVAGFSVEPAAEFAKDLVWEKRQNILEDQLFILAEQNRRQMRLLDQVDYIISDSPLLLSLVYLKTPHPTAFSYLVKELFEQYNNLNFFLARNPAFGYDPNGRTQASVEEARDADRRLAYYLPKDSINVNFEEDYSEQILKWIEK